MCGCKVLGIPPGKPLYVTHTHPHMVKVTHMQFMQTIQIGWLLYLLQTMSVYLCVHMCYVDSCSIFHYDPGTVLGVVSPVEHC